MKCLTRVEILILFLLSCTDTQIDQATDDPALPDSGDTAPVVVDTGAQLDVADQMADDSIQTDQDSHIGDQDSLEIDPDLDGSQQDSAETDQEIHGVDQGLELLFDTDLPSGEDLLPLIPTEPLSLCINEFMPSNDDSLVLGESTPDWIEIHNPTDTDIELAGWSISDDPGSPQLHRFAEGQVVTAGGFILLYADGAPDLGEDHLGFALSVDGETLLLTAPDGRQSHLDYPELEEDVSALRSADCCRGEGCWTYAWYGTPGESNEIPRPAYEEVDLFETTSNWRYHDQGVSLPASWSSPTYDDSDWSVGVGPLGYGDDHIATEVGYGPDPFARYITTYFRAEFEVEAPGAVEQLTVSLMRDDGAVVYLNEVEVFRSNMPDGVIIYDTLAVETLWEVSTETTYVTGDVDPGLLLPGVNQLAVELHQAIPDSSDLGFDLGVMALLGNDVQISDDAPPISWIDFESLPPYNPLLPRPCPDLYDPDILPEFFIEIAEEEWSGLLFEYANGGYAPGNPELKPYHPLLSFEYEGEVIENAEIRLKGWPGSFVDWSKMQFVIRFNGIDSSGRFQGLRRLALDAPYYEDSLLRERLSLTYFRQDMEIPGSCVNHARLVVNGSFYGLYTNIEALDEELLERVFGNDGPDEGYLYKYVPDVGWELKEGGEVDDLAALDDLFATWDYSGMEAIFDMDAYFRYVAAEATLPDEDNYFVGSINYAWYQHPDRGWMLLPWDHDWGFLTSDLNPRTMTSWTWLNEHLWVLLQSPLVPAYERVLQEAIAVYDPDLFSERLQTWSEQIRPSVFEDPSMSILEFETEVERLGRFFYLRQDYLDSVFP